MKKLLTLAIAATFLFACGDQDDSDIPVIQAGGLSNCETAYDCALECEDSYCVDKCVENLPLKDVRKYQGVLECVVKEARDCNSKECIRRECYSDVLICEGPTKHQLSCSEAVECATTCLGPDCDKGCEELATPEAIELSEEIFICATRCEGSQSCLENECSDLVVACMND